MSQRSRRSLRKPERDEQNVLPQFPNLHARTKQSRFPGINSPNGYGQPGNFRKNIQGSARRKAWIRMKYCLFHSFGTFPILKKRADVTAGTPFLLVQSREETGGKTARAARQGNPAESQPLWAGTVFQPCCQLFLPTGQWEKPPGKSVGILPGGAVFHRQTVSSGSEGE